MFVYIATSSNSTPHFYIGLALVIRWLVRYIIPEPHITQPPVALIKDIYVCAGHIFGGLVPINMTLCSPSYNICLLSAPVTPMCPHTFGANHLTSRGTGVVLGVNISLSRLSL